MFAVSRSLTTPPLSSPAPQLADPQINAVAFSTSTIKSGRVAVAKIDCSGIRPEDIRCESTSHGFEIEVLPARARHGRFVVLAIRIHRRLGAPRSLCLVRFTAGAHSAAASVTVLG